MEALNSHVSDLYEDRVEIHPLKAMLERVNDGIKIRDLLLRKIWRQTCLFAVNDLLYMSTNCTG